MESTPKSEMPPTSRDSDAPGLSYPNDGLLFGEVQAALQILPKSAGSLEERRQIARLRQTLALDEAAQADLGINGDGRITRPQAAAQYRQPIEEEQKTVLRDALLLWIEERFDEGLWTEQALWILISRLGVVGEALETCEERSCYPTGAWFDLVLDEATAEE